MNSYIPDINIPNIEIPSIDIPDFYIPNIEIPSIDIPDFYIPDIEIPSIDIPNFYIPDIEIPSIDIPNFYIPDISIENSTILEITNTQDTNIIDASDGLSLGEAIEITNNDPENNYVIEIPSGSNYTATLDENLSRPIILKSTGDGLTNVTITSSESLNQLTLWGESVVVLGDSSIHNEVSYSSRTVDILTGAEQDIYNQIINQFDDRFTSELNAYEDGLDYWTEQLDRGSVDSNTFALEMSLETQSEDIFMLDDIQAEINIYSGSSAEVFGQEWGDNFGNTTIFQEQVDFALDDLVGIDF